MFFNKKLHAQIRALQAGQKALEEQLKWAKANTARLHRKLRQSEDMRLKAQAQETPVLAKRLTGIKFKALFDGRYQATQFIIGMGQCGKTVKYFTENCSDGIFRICQWHTDGTHKEFTYRLSDIDGRIQYDYEMVPVEGEEARAERHTNFRFPLTYP
ncbi:hypothetical protein [Kosakonia phage Kc166A]|uniref:Uncharacterized protein n=1 Tax=Kosakonia phage Kc166A TaxID=2801381 RepID=A0AAE7UUS2_9CAUD|nr:hypothetical protein [Kosakonia phage Kc166A]